MFQSDTLFVIGVLCFVLFIAFLADVYGQYKRRTVALERIADALTGPDAPDVLRGGKTLLR
ncbi:hypothetical protein CLV92_114106 [Kineococcus xinjiangensis]|uniref:Uncharacterized protein n=1 Tax=Kineococcus xinjiangensis TaxID=512762 RepID=A0A2S6IE56_9ACTN|nr:hypothetical protein [Kineococcus xinjiangensis]PPK92505.1 hypothetical protein CLV92_114106 [Kineococcus xinjiangensis]